MWKVIIGFGRNVGFLMLVICKLPGPRLGDWIVWYGGGLLG